MTATAQADPEAMRFIVAITHLHVLQVFSYEELDSLAFSRN
ncbi:hypothetical protein A1122_15660 [Yersinia pestis A1122]|nr:hypothetical protein A1122_15660 [Yersinia pestis A1122]EEO77014.1 hypothetical protein YP516_1746 [Yersinia pestis Nepal516]EKS46509.1 hypothetical protein INS_10932 [Yersinia pestis INS]